jgi:hypothetical protein
MEETCSSEKSVDFQVATRHYIIEYRIIQETSNFLGGHFFYFLFDPEDWGVMFLQNVGINIYQNTW